jgi:N-sulfoglucosamine sulfohydrolase
MQYVSSVTASYRVFRSFDFLFIALWLLFNVTASNLCGEEKRPNVVFLFADDLGRYASCYAKADGPGTLNDVVKTPHIDQIASHGVTFRNAFVNAPSCTPCRTSLCAGQPFWRGTSASVLQGARWDFRLPAFPLMLQQNGYHIGKAFKVWSPGTPGDAPIGGNKYAYQKRGGRINQYSKIVTKLVQEGTGLEEARASVLAEVRGNFEDFLNDRKGDEPFFFWYGPTNVHRTWEKGSGKALWGIDPDQLQGKVPPFLPDVPEIREDLADYLGEVQAFDASIGIIVEVLQQKGLLDNTILIVSGDHGAPGFSNGKCNLYDFGCQVPLVVQPTAAMRQAMPQAGVVVDDLVSLVDLAPTILEWADIAPHVSMTGKSLVPQVTSGKSGIIDSSRSAVTMGRERHVAAVQGDFSHYPQRALRTPDFLYIMNFAPERWPMGQPVFEDENGKALGPEPTMEQLTNNTFVAFGDMDASPAKAWLVNHRHDPTVRPFYNRAFAKRPAEELFDLKSDKYQMNNVAYDAAYAEVKARLRSQLLEQLISTHDPRVVGGGWYFENPPMSTSPGSINFVIHRPSKYEVFQRNALGQGEVLLQGALPIPEVPAGRAAGNERAKAKAVSTQWEVRVLDSNEKQVVAWKLIPTVPIDRYLNTKILVPQGGWYFAEVRNALDHEERIRSEMFGVGDVYLVAGQSNSANYGSVRTQPTSDMVSAFDGRQWKIAKDPQPGAAGEQGSFVPALGDLLVERERVPIGFASVGMGGTSVREWLPRGTRFERQPTTGANCWKHPEGGFESTGELFNRLTERLVYFGPTGVKAILWHQGESDAGQARAGYPKERQISGEDYRHYMEGMIERTRKVAQWDVPWLVAQATYHSEDDANDEEFRQAQREVTKLKAVYPGADTDLLRAEFRDGVHFNERGLKAHAKFWSDTIANIK